MNHDSKKFHSSNGNTDYKNNDSSNIEFNPGKFLASDDKGNYLTYDSVISNDDTVAIQSKSVVIQAGKRATIAIVYAMDNDHSDNDVNKIEFGGSTWTK